MQDTQDKKRSQRRKFLASMAALGMAAYAAPALVCINEAEAAATPARKFYSRPSYTRPSPRSRPSWRSYPSPRSRPSWP